jgi:holo-[acyl-carrier protein] synthase
MIFGVGVDLVQVARIGASLERYGERFARRILAEEELPDFRSAARRSHFLAKRFAAKEACAKALGTGMRHGVSFRDIRVAHDAAGRPSLALTGKARALADARRIAASHLSLTDEAH